MPNLRERKCRTCGKPVLSGESDSWCAFPVQVDRTPLGHQGEALAWLDGRGTYLLRRGSGAGFRLQTRDRWQIGGARTPRWADIVADHRCGLPLPGIASRIELPAPDEGSNDDPAPF